MKITISNLGPIKQAEIDVKPLTILVGENNTGKTWLAYTIAGALGPYGWRRYLSAYVAGKTPEKYKKLDDIIKLVTKNGDGVLDIVQFADEYSEKCINGMLTFARTWMRHFLSIDYVQFDTLDIKANVMEIKAALLQRLENISIADTIGQNEESPLLRALKEPGERKLFFYPGQNITDRLPARAVKEFVAGTVFREILQFFYPNIHAFPTERASIVNNQFAFLLALTRSIATRVTNVIDEEVNSVVEEMRGGPKPRPQPWLISSFTNMMMELHENGSITTRKEQASEQRAVQRYIDLADILQEDILGGSLDFSTPDPSPGREILFQPAEVSHGGATKLEVSMSSSMVKELSSLVLYLRYVAKPGELIVIDEPEMNLHPAAQVKIIEFLAMLVNAGLNVLFITHSPYITDHLSNLIKANESEEKETIRNEFYLKRTDAFISKELVSVYGISEGKVNDVLDEDGLINWSTFGDVSEHIINLYMKL